MSFYEAITWDYVIVCVFSLAIMILAIIYRLSNAKDYSNDQGQDDDSGGQDTRPDEPILDLPDGVSWSVEKEELV